MGYSHYWNRSADFTTEQWEKISLETLDIIVRHCDKKKIVLAFEYDSPAVPQPVLFGGPSYGPKPPEVSPDLIRFNGWKDEGHETFYLTRENFASQPHNPNVTESFDFCKTARKPYDLAVCLVLLSMKRHAPESVIVSSDGDWDVDWAEARKVYKKLFSVDVECPWVFAEA